MSGERKRTHEDDLEALSEAINIAIADLEQAAYEYGYEYARRRVDVPPSIATARDALVIAIADRVREVRSGKP